MLKHWFVWDEELEYLRTEFEAPYEKLSKYFDSNVMNARGAQASLDHFQPVLDGRVPHLSGTGNGWWFEVGPATTRVGHLLADPVIELELPTETFIALHIVYRDGRLAHAASRKPPKDRHGFASLICDSMLTSVRVDVTTPFMHAIVTTRGRVRVRQGVSQRARSDRREQACDTPRRTRTTRARRDLASA